MSVATREILPTALIELMATYGSNERLEGKDAVSWKHKLRDIQRTYELRNSGEEWAGTVDQRPELPRWQVAR